MSDKDRHEQVYFKHVNLYDIPRGIVPEQVYEMAEAMKEDNLQEWKHVIMGETGDAKTLVFPNLKPMREEDVNWDAKENWALGRGWKVCLGCDYGYAPDITAFTVSIYNKIMKVLWVIDECGGNRWSEAGIYEHVKEVLDRRGGKIAKRAGIDINITPSSVINSEIDNRIIDGLRSAGLNIYPVKKFSGSRDVSYQFLTGGYGDVREIWVDSEQCPGTWAEMIGAEFPRRDINGKEVIIQEWPNYNDHFL